MADKPYNIGLDALLRVTIRLTGRSSKTPAKLTEQAINAIRKALTEANLGAIPTGGIEFDGLAFAEITEATMQEEPEPFEFNGEEVVDGLDGFCRTCGEVYSGFGDGWDRQCGNCADSSENEK